jgi:hypothetical protein
MRRFPKWAPEIVTRFVERAEREPHDEAAKERLRWLVSDPNMEAVWRTLSKDAPAPEVLENFARWAALSLWLSWGRRLLPEISNATRKRALVRIGQLAKNLLDELRTLSGRDSNAARGVAAVADAFYRAELGAVAADPRAVPRLASLRLYLNSPSHQETLVRGLSALADAARGAANAPPRPGPRKLAAGTAVRTAYALELDRFLRTHFKKPLYAAIAVTANVMLREHDNPLSADHVRKLILAAKKISSKRRS